MTALPASRSRTCWALAFGFVVLTHAGLIAVLGSATPPRPAEPGVQPAIMVNLAPDPSAPDPSADVANEPVAETVPMSLPPDETPPPPLAEPPAIKSPSPDMPPPEARPPAFDVPPADVAAPDAVDETPPPTVEAPSPTAETPPSVQLAEPPAASPAARAVPVPQAPPAAKPKVIPPKPVPARPRPPDLSRPATTASASPAPPPLAETAAHPPVLNGPGASLSWQTRLLAHLNRFKRFPADAQMRRRQGTTLIRLRLMPDGSAEGVRIDGSSGTASLDQEAVALIARAVPLPVPDRQAGAIEIAIPILFTIK